MKVEVFHAARDAGAWEANLSHFVRSDVYFQAGYLRAAALHQGGEPFGFSASLGDWHFFNPFLLMPLHSVAGETLSIKSADVESAYGYGGPLATDEDEAFLAQAWQMFHEWCRVNGVVAEFTRFHPLLGNHRLAARECEVSRERSTIVLPLSGTVADLEAQATGNHRNMVRKAVKAGLTASEEPLDAAALEQFATLYHDTMRRLGAGPDYFFDNAYFEELRSVPLRLFTVKQGDVLAAAALFFQHGPYFHYHLAGSDPAFRSLAANNLLLHTAACAAQSAGCTQFHLGGGRTSSPDDSLFLFKKSISPAGETGFYLGRRVHDAARYEELCSLWKSRAGDGKVPARFLLYRLPIPV